MFWGGPNLVCEDVLCDHRKLDGPQMGKMGRSRKKSKIYAGTPGSEQIVSVHKQTCDDGRM